jgi:hypothetical protein
MTVLYIFLLLLINFTIYKIWKGLKSENFQIAFIVILIIIAKIAKDTKDDINFSLVGLFLFSLAIPIFSYGFRYVSHNVKTEKSKRKLTNLELKVDTYLTKNNYASHITIFITSYQVLSLLLG